MQHRYMLVAATKSIFRAHHIATVLAKRVAASRTRRSREEFQDSVGKEGESHEDDLANDVDDEWA